MSVIGYARTSTLHQDAGLDAQLRQLQALGCDKIFAEQVSSVAERARLAAALEYAREGDTFVVTKLDRLARSVAHLVEITAELKRKGVELKIIDMGVDTSTPTGRYKGRSPTARNKSAEIHRLAGEGVGKTEIARRLGVGERSVYRMLTASGGDTSGREASSATVMVWVAAEVEAGPGTEGRIITSASVGAGEH